MLRSLQLKNIRGFRNTGVVQLRPLTLVVGPNNVGKSTLLHALLLLKQTLDDSSRQVPLTFSGSTIDLGSFNDLVRGGLHASSNTVSFSLGIPDWVADSWEAPPVDSEWTRPTEFTFSVAYDAQENRMYVPHARLSRGSETVLEVKSDDGRGYMLRPKRLAHARLYWSNFLPAARVPSEERGDEPIEQLRNLDESLKSLYAVEGWRGVIRGLDHIPPVREPIPRLTILGRTTEARGGVGGENLLRLLHTAHANGGARLIDRVDYWMADRFKMLRSLRLQEIDQAGRVLALLADERNGFKGINIANMGEGISQLLPIVASVAIAEEGGCLLIEQPELHLHPAAQADLGDLFSDAIAGGRGRQLIVETHSEHLLLRIRRRIAAGDLTPDQVAVLYVEKPGRESRVRQLELDSKGQFAEWPAGFFEEGYVEALELAKASSPAR